MQIKFLGVSILDSSMLGLTESLANEFSLPSGLHGYLWTGTILRQRYLIDIHFPTLS